MRNSAVLLSLIALVGIASQSRGEEPAPTPSELQALRDEVLSVLERRHVLRLSQEELLNRWQRAERSYERQRVEQASNQPFPPIGTSQGFAPIRFRNPVRKSAQMNGVVSALNPENAPARNVNPQTEPDTAISPAERFFGVFEEFSALVPGTPALLASKNAKIEQQFAANSYVGLGVTLFAREGIPGFVGIVPGGSADRFGLKPGVLILEIDGWETQGQPMEDIIDRIRGPVGTMVKLRIKQDQKTEEISIPRDFVRFDSIKDLRDRPMSKSDWRHPNDPRVAYLRFHQLVSSTVQELRQIEAEVRRSECEAVIFDLRPVHRVGEWRHIRLLSDELTDGGVMWEEIDREGAVTPIRADEDRLFRNLPMIVITESHRAEQVQALALSLHRTGRAILINDVVFSGTQSQITPDDPVLAYPTESIDLCGGRWILNVPTRLWRTIADSSQERQPRYSCTYEAPTAQKTPFPIPRWNSTQLRLGDPILEYQRKIIITPAIPEYEKVGPKDILDLALYLAYQAIEQGFNP